MLTDEENERLKEIGNKAERKVLNSLATLAPIWKVYSSVEWRNILSTGEQIGESDVVIFHPEHGIIVIEIKAGNVNIRNGVWRYGSGRKMYVSPFKQARRNRYALLNQLEKKINTATLNKLVITHAAWFPEVIWKSEVIDADCPSRDFILDKSTLANPETALLKIFETVDPKSTVKWSQQNISALKTLLEPTITINKPLSVDVEDTNYEIELATDAQTRVLQVLHSQKRLLIEGGAGSGKTRLALSIAITHAKQGKRVLFTCFNKPLLNYIANQNKDIENLKVAAFHDIVKEIALDAGMQYNIPTDNVLMTKFFKEDSPELLYNAAQISDIRFDTIIVDEANDFLSTWWIALEALGAENFNWYCFYDKQQILYVDKNEWEPPFIMETISLPDNLRNTKPIGEFAATQGNFIKPNAYRINEGHDPVVYSADSLVELGKYLNTILTKLIEKEYILPEQIAILSPYRCKFEAEEWQAALKGFKYTEQLFVDEPGKVKVGTIQSFKGLESDVVILFGIDKKIIKREEILYVGCTRAKSLLYVLKLD